MTPPATLAHRSLAFGIGLFALWQMAFIVAANLIDLVPRRIITPEGTIPLDPIQEVGTFTTIEPLQRTAERVGDVIDAYSEFTGQEQCWPLFAPGFPPHSTFTAVELHFADGRQVELLSRFEPADYNRVVPRLPFFNVRRYNAEIQFTPPIMQHTESAIASDPGIIRAQTFGFFRACQPALMCWLRWQVKEYSLAHPESGAPTEVTYVARYVPTPLPLEPKVWDKPVRVRPLVRWYPGRPVPAGVLPMQLYDVTAQKWVTLLTDGGER